MIKISVPYKVLNLQNLDGQICNHFILTAKDKFPYDYMGQNQKGWLKCQLWAVETPIVGA